MPLNINQEDFNVVKQPFINKYLKLNVLNFNLSVVNEISGNLISFDVSVNADSDLRRSCSVSFVVTDSSFEPEPGSQVWLNNFIQPYVGYENIYTGEVQWYNQGIYLINTPTYFYDATNNTLSFQGLDLMSKLTGVRNGALPGVPTIIPQGSNVREAMIAAIKLAGFTKYVVNECTNTDGSIQAVPYDIQVNQGGYIFDIIKQLRDILPNYQVYFDVDGVFHYDQIPSGDNDPVLIDDTLWNDVNMSDNITTDFESVKNYIEVYGKSHTVNYFPSATSVSGGTLNLTIAGYTETAGNMIGFVPTTNIVTSAYVKVNNGTARKLVDSAGNGVKNLDKDVYYVAVYQSNNTYLFLGHQQAQAIATDDNPESPFYVNGSVGMIRQVLSGGDYDNIMSDELALQRAKLEIYWKCRLNDSIALTCIPIPWVDVNILVSHAPKNSSRQKKYMVKSFNASYGDNTTMTINAISYYAYYSPTPKPEPVLPEGYTQLNYIQSTGTQYIDTGASFSNGVRVEIKFNLTSITASSKKTPIFGAHNVSEPYGRDYLSVDSSKNFEIGGGAGYRFFKNNTIATNVDYEVEASNIPGQETLIVNGELYEPTGGQAYATPFTDLPLYLFRVNTTNEAWFENASMKLCCAKFYDDKNVLIRNFVSCKNPSGEVGLYDYVTKAFYGNAGGGSLPDGYTELEYLQSTGTQYIDSGVKGDSDVRVTADFEITAFDSGTTFVFGAQGTNSIRYTLGMTSAGAFRSDFGTAMTSGSAASLNTRYAADKNGNVCTVGGQTLTSAAATFTGTTNIYLFGRSYSSISCSKIKMYRCKMYKAGALVRDFIPARNSSGTLGLYDTVNGTFYTNAGTGTFVAGAEINHNFIAGAEV